MKINLANGNPNKGSKEGRWRDIPEGDYTIIVDSVDFTDGDKPFFMANYLITDGPYEGEIIKDYLGLSSNMQWKLKRVFLAAGYEPNQEIEFDNEREFSELLKGRVFNVKLEKREADNGKVYLNCTRWDRTSS